MPGVPYKSTKDEFGEEILDTSEHWGRVEKTCGLQFMAAPLIWFGRSFDLIISFEKLTSFKFSTIVSINGNDVIQIRLFDIYDLPSIEKNRDKQKEFWKFFDLKNVIQKFQKNNEISAVESLEAFIKRRSHKKK